MDSNEPIALNQLHRSAANFRLMMNTFSDAYVEAVAKGNKEAMFRAIRSYIDLAEVSTPDLNIRGIQS